VLVWREWSPPPKNVEEIKKEALEEQRLFLGELGRKKTETELRTELESITRRLNQLNGRKVYHLEREIRDGDSYRVDRSVFEHHVISNRLDNLDALVSQEVKAGLDWTIVVDQTKGEL